MDARYEGVTPESLKAEMLEVLSGTVETREGSYANTLLSPAAYQLYKIYQLLPLIELMAFPDETAGEYIDRRAGDFGITRTAGTEAAVALRFTAAATASPQVPAGTAVCTEEGLRFLTTEAAVFSGGVADVSARAEKPGRAYNVEANTITVMQVNVAGVSAVTNPQAAAGGADEETDAALLQRYHEHLQRPVSSGNKNHYVAWAKEVQGVSYAAAVPLWNGPGTVKVIAGGPEKDPVDQSVITACAAHIEAERPIGASVTVVSVESKTVDVAATVTLSGGATPASVQAELTASLKQLLAGLPFGESSTLRYSRALVLLLDCQGVEEYQSLTLNGAAVNVSATAEQTLTVGNVTISAT